MCIQPHMCSNITPMILTCLIYINFIVFQNFGTIKIYYVEFAEWHSDVP